MVDDYRLGVGDFISFEIGSFSLAMFSEGETAGHIQWKSNDKAILAIERPRVGLLVDYSTVQNVGFYAGDEREILVTGDYSIIKIELVEFFTKSARYQTSPWRVPVYTLRAM